MANAAASKTCTIYNAILNDPLLSRRCAAARYHNT
jgi:hypothetical protein